MARWRTHLTALGAGALAATGFQPIMAWPVALAALAVWIALVTTAPRARDAALRGWLFGLGHFSLVSTSRCFS